MEIDQPLPVQKQPAKTLHAPSSQLTLTNYLVTAKALPHEEAQRDKHQQQQNLPRLARDHQVYYNLSFNVVNSPDLDRDLIVSARMAAIDMLKLLRDKVNDTLVLYRYMAPEDADCFMKAIDGKGGCGPRSPQDAESNRQVFGWIPCSLREGICNVHQGLFRD